MIAQSTWGGKREGLKFAAGFNCQGRTEEASNARVTIQICRSGDTDL